MPLFSLNHGSEIASSRLRRTSFAIITDFVPKAEPVSVLLPFIPSEEGLFRYWLTVEAGSFTRFSIFSLEAMG